MLRSESAADPALRRAALRGLAAYQAAPRAQAPPPRPIGARAGRVTLRDGGGTGRPVLLIPSLINPPDILDLPGRSLLARIAGAGMHGWLLDWGTPGVEDAALDLTEHVERFLIPLIATFAEPPVLVGYCLGGTLALAAAACVPVAGIAVVATPWHFGGYPEPARADMAGLWNAARDASAALGMLPMETLQAGFWRLDPARTIAKYADFAALPPGGEAARTFVALEDWANDGAPLPHAVARQLFEDFVAADLPGRGGWRVDGRVVDPATFDCPTLAFVSTSDRIVPAATAPRLHPTRRTRTGHVGMMVGRGAEAALHGPLVDWIETLPCPNQHRQTP